LRTRAAFANSGKLVAYKIQLFNLMDLFKNYQCNSVQFRFNRWPKFCQSALFHLLFLIFDHMEKTRGPVAHWPDYSLGCLFIYYIWYVPIF
jgi:hypothetical protein